MTLTCTSTLKLFKSDFKVHYLDLKVTQIGHNGKALKFRTISNKTTRSVCKFMSYRHLNTTKSFNMKF